MNNIHNFLYYYLRRDVGICPPNKLKIEKKTKMEI